jgi:catechol 2,3-dioxygenase-like lactoylglutathione lyase family enzyme
MTAAHIGMTICDTERTLDFYCNVLGATLLWKAKAPQQGPQTDEIFGLDNTIVSVSGVNLHGLVLEFFEFHHPTVDEASYRTSYTTGGWKHLALVVDDIKAKVEELKGAGVHFHHSIQTLPNGTKMAYFNDPDGIMLELNQPSEDDHAYPSR